MTDLNKVESEIRDTDVNEIVEETLEEAQAPKAKSGSVDGQQVSEPEAIASVDKAANATKQAPARTGDKKNSEKSNLPKTKAGLLNAMYQAASKMKKTDLQAAYGKVCEALNIEEEFVSEDVDTNAELQAIVEGEATLSEEFKEKTAVIFEAAVKSKLAEEVERLEESYKEELAEEVSTIKEDLVGKVDSYLNYVVESWMEENKVAIENGLRTEIAENFMASMKNLFVESYIEVPESKVDLVDDLAEQVEELEEKLNTTTGDAIALAEELETYERNSVIAEASRDLADTQAEKLAELVESVEFDENFASKVATIKENYFAKEIPAVEEAISEEVEEEIEVSSIMESYLAAIKKTSK